MFRIRINFFRVLIRIQRLRLETNTDPDPDPIRIQGFNDQKLKKNLQLKKKKKFLIKNCNLPIPRPPYSMSKLQKKPAAHKRGHPTLQNMNFSTFVGHFCPPGSGSGFRIRIRIRIHVPNWIRIQSGSGSETLWGIFKHKRTNKSNHRCRIVACGSWQLSTVSETSGCRTQRSWRSCCSCCILTRENEHITTSAYCECYFF